MLELLGRLFEGPAPKLASKSCEEFRVETSERLDLFFNLPGLGEEFACPKLGQILKTFAERKATLLRLAQLAVVRNDQRLWNFVGKAVDRFVEGLEGLEVPPLEKLPPPERVKKPETGLSELPVDKRPFRLVSLKRGRGKELELAKVCFERKGGGPDVSAEDRRRLLDLLEELVDLLPLSEKEMGLLKRVLEVFKRYSEGPADSTLPRGAFRSYLLQHFFPFKLEAAIRADGRLVCFRFARRLGEKPPSDRKVLKEWATELLASWREGKDDCHDERGAAGGSIEKRLPLKVVFFRALKRYLLARLEADYYGIRCLKNKDLLKALAGELERLLESPLFAELAEEFFRLAAANVVFYRFYEVLRREVPERGGEVGFEAGVYSYDERRPPTFIKDLRVVGEVSSFAVVLSVGGGANELRPLISKLQDELRRRLGKKVTFTNWNLDLVLGKGPPAAKILRLFLFGEALGRLGVPVFVAYPERRRANRYYDLTEVLKFFTHKQFLTLSALERFEGGAGRLVVENALSSLLKGVRSVSATVGVPYPFAKPLEVGLLLTEQFNSAFSPEELRELGLQGQGHFFGGGRLFKVSFSPAEGGLLNLRIELLGRYFFLPLIFGGGLKVVAGPDAAIGADHLLHVTQFSDEEVNAAVENGVTQFLDWRPVYRSRGFFAAEVPLWVLKRRNNRVKFAEGFELGLVEGEGNEYAFVTLPASREQTGANAFVVRFRDLSETDRLVLKYSMLALGLFSSDAVAGYEYTRPKSEREHLYSKKFWLKVGKREFLFYYLNAVCDYMVAAY
ncbi:MAG: hypothetical protein GXO08_00420 [Aquificae bacterium]|nr:hypothetical protein [Aquificota bacterium]